MFRITCSDKAHYLPTLKRRLNKNVPPVGCHRPNCGTDKCRGLSLDAVCPERRPTSVFLPVSKPLRLLAHEVCAKHSRKLAGFFGRSFGSGLVPSHVARSLLLRLFTLSLPNRNPSRTERSFQ